MPTPRKRLVLRPNKLREVLHFLFNPERKPPIKAPVRNDLQDRYWRRVKELNPDVVEGPRTA
jgi:hypothetical protein